MPPIPTCGESGPEWRLRPIGCGPTSSCSSATTRSRSERKRHLTRVRRNPDVTSFELVRIDLVDPEPAAQFTFRAFTDHLYATGDAVVAPDLDERFARDDRLGDRF